MSLEDSQFSRPRTADRVVGVKSERREDLIAVAVAQKSLLTCIVLYILCICAQLMLSQYREAANYSIITTIAALVVVLVGLVSVLLIAVRVYNIGCGGYLLLGIGTLMPCLGLLVLLMINSKATRILQENGHHVGLLGVDLSEF